MTRHSYNKPPVSGSDNLSKLKQNILQRKQRKLDKKIDRFVNKNRKMTKTTNPSWSEYHGLISDISSILIDYKKSFDIVISTLNTVPDTHKTEIRPYLNTFITDLTTFSQKVITMKQARACDIGPVEEKDIMTFYAECMEIDTLLHNVLYAMGPVQLHISQHIDKIYNRLKHEGNVNATAK